MIHFYYVLSILLLSSLAFKLIFENLCALQLNENQLHRSEVEVPSVFCFAAVRYRRDVLRIKVPFNERATVPVDLVELSRGARAVEELVDGSIVTNLPT